MSKSSACPIPVNHPYIAPGGADSRAPCPGLNTLANHGFLPHDGKEISVWQLMKGLRQCYNISIPYCIVLGVGAILYCGHWPGKLNLHEIAKPNKICHDASLFHEDPSTGNVMVVQRDQITALFNDSSDGVGLSLEDFARARIRREAHIPGRFISDKTLRTFAYGESVFAHAIFGGHIVSGRAPIAHLKPFFEENRLPDDWVRPTFSLGLINCAYGIKTIGNMIASMEGKGK